MGAEWGVVGLGGGGGMGGGRGCWGGGGGFMTIFLTPVITPPSSILSIWFVHHPANGLFPAAGPAALIIFCDYIAP